MAEIRQYLCGKVLASVCDDGNVFVSGVRLQPYKNKWGYLFVCFGGKKHFLHVLVLTVFSGPRPQQDMDACHRDGDKSNNSADNLYWGTKKQNGRDRVAHGRSFPGESNIAAVLNRAQARAIMHMVNLDPNFRPRACAIAALFGVSDQAILNIWHRKSWRKDTDDIKINNRIVHFNTKRRINNDCE